MKYIGYPLVGDPKYGPKKTLEFNGQVLHAGTLGFDHPVTGEYLEFKALYLKTLKSWLKKLGKALTKQKSEMYTEQSN